MIVAFGGTAVTHPSTTHLVTLFQDSNFGGKQWGFDCSSLVPSDADDQASSFIVQPGYSATFYRDANFQNPLLTQVQGANAWVGLAANDVISSVRIYEASTGRELNPGLNYPLTLFQDVDYGGQSWGLSRSTNIPPIANDQASSFVVAPGYRAELYRDANFQNPIMACTAGQSDPWVGANVNDAVSSVRIFEAGTNTELNPPASHPVTLYQDVNYRGTSWAFDASAPEIDATANDQTSSLVVAEGFRCIAYPDANFGGTPHIFDPTSNGAWLPGTLNDTISSLRVMAAIGQQSGGPYYREVPNLSQLVVTFHTGSDDKDHDTGLDIEYFDARGMLVGSVLGYQPGGFSDGSLHSVTIPVTRSMKVSDARGGMLRLTIFPKGDDTWRFGVQLDLIGSDGARSTVSSYFAGQSLETDHPQVELNVPNAIRGESEVQLVLPGPSTTVGGLSVPLAVYAENVQGIEFSAWYADDPNDYRTVKWHDLGTAQQSQPNVWTLTWDTTPVIDQGNGGWGTVNICASATDSGWPNLSPRVYTRLDIANQLPISGASMSFPGLTDNANLAGAFDIVVNATGVHEVAVDAYVTDGNGNSAWRYIGRPVPDVGRTVWNWPGWDTTQFPDQGSTTSGTVKFRATALGQYNGSAPVAYSPRVNIFNHPLVVVPNVVGMLLSDAHPILESAKLRDNEIDPPGIIQTNQMRITGQTPAAGSRVPLNTTVDLTVVAATTAPSGCSVVRCWNENTDSTAYEIWTYTAGSWKDQGKATSLYDAESNSIPPNATPFPVTLTDGQISLVAAFPLGSDPASTQAQAWNVYQGQSNGPTVNFQFQ